MLFMPENLWVCLWRVKHLRGAEGAPVTYEPSRGQDKRFSLFSPDGVSELTVIFSAFLNVLLTALPQNWQSDRAS
jgi:hypothetical protein